MLLEWEARRVTEPHKTLLINGGDPTPSRRASHHRVGWRRPDPLALAVIAAGALCVLGLALAVIPPLTSHPRAEALPASSATGAPIVPAPAADTSPTANPLASATLLTGPPAAVTARPPTSKPSDLESQLVRLTNQARSQAHCHAVKNDSHLRAAARTHSADMAANDFVGQAGSDGSSFATRAHKAGYKHPLGENDGSGYRTAQEAIEVWLATSAQAKNIRDCKAKAVGVGVTVAKSGIAYWTEDFGD